MPNEQQLRCVVSYRMKLLYKHLTKELFKNKIFVFLLLVLTASTSSMYFFVHFSIDGNMLWLDSLAIRSNNQLLYRNALVSNTILARNVLIALTSLTGFVFAMFFYRFFRSSAKQLGCLKSLGFNNNALRNFFIGFTGILSLIGALIGFGAGYFASDILLQANAETYFVKDLVKELTGKSLFIGLLAPMTVFCMIAFGSYALIQGKEVALLIAGINHKTPYAFMLHVANKIATLCPEKNRLSIRLAFRKPLAVFLIVFSVMSFSVMFLLGYSLTLSSQKVFESQTTGHHYLYETRFDAPQRLHSSKKDTMSYLDTTGTISGRNVRLEQTIAGVEDNPGLFSLMDTEGNTIILPNQGEMVIGAELQERYGFQKGDQVTISVDKTQRSMTISDIAFNAKSNWVYLSKTELSELLHLPTDSYTGILHMATKFDGGTVITREQKLDALQRASVSNRNSAVINQAIGCLVGCILLYLALLLNFQDSTRDVLILHLMGFPSKDIRKMLLNIYQPILWLAFFLTLFPSIQIVKTILKSLSLQIGDYLPSQTNFFVIAGVFVLLNLLYLIVQATFQVVIHRLITKESITTDG